MKFNAHGTLGDTYIIVCKLLQFGNESIEVFHRTNHKYWYSKIKEVYSLLPNVSVTEVDALYSDYKDISISCHEDNMEFFPDWHIEHRFNITKPYIVIQPHSGKTDEGSNIKNNMKRFNPLTVQKLINYAEKKVVVLGTDLDYKFLTNCENLIGMTSIADLIPIIKHSCRFIGPEGLMSFIALSQRISSVVYYTHKNAVDLRIIGTPWEKYCEELRGGLL